MLSVWYVFLLPKESFDKYIYNISEYTPTVPTVRKFYFLPEYLVQNIKGIVKIMKIMDKINQIWSGNIEKTISSVTPKFLSFYA